MAFTKIVSPGIDTTGSYTVQELNTVGVMTAGAVQVGSATTIRTTGIDLGSGNLTLHNINSTGIITATSFVGPVTGNITGDITAASGTFTGNVTIGGTLTYDDVTNIDSVGVITARSGVNVTGGQLNVGSDIHVGAGLSVVGVSTLSNTVVGGATTELVVTGDARVTGILTVGTASITLDGTTGKISGLNNAQIGSISSSISDTAVDVFVYDTSKDSDGGAWRKRTQNTSWHNETLGTATRGSRKEFPAVAVIVAETTQVTIYDGDDPDLPMWMVFNQTGGSDGQNRMLNRHMGNLKSVSMLNGNLTIFGLSTSSADRGGGVWINFISEFGYAFGTSDAQGENIYGTLLHNIAQRNTILGTDLYADKVQRYQLVDNSQCHDVAIAVLPNAPIDIGTGLPIPTIAVATDGGISVIRDDGTVADLTGFSPTTTVHIGEGNMIGTSNSGNIDYVFKTHIPSADEAFTSGITAGSKNYYMNSNSGTTPLLRDINMTDTSYNTKNNVLYRGGNAGFDIIMQGDTNSSTNSDPTIAYITTDYNTGYMHGDIKGAFLSDTDDTNITGTSLIANGDFSANSTAAFTTVAGGTAAVTGGLLRLTDTGGAFCYASAPFTTVIGNQYYVTVDIVNNSNTANANYIRCGNSHNGTGLHNTNYGTSYGTKTFYFTATATTTYLTLISGNGVGETGHWDNVFVYKLDNDRSINTKGIQPYGTITKSAVATGADLIAYSGFSASNYLKQPYNSDLDFGTGDFYAGIWVYGGSDAKSLIIREEPATDQNGSFLIFQNSGVFQFYIKGDGQSAWTSFAGTATYGNYWSCVYLVRSGNTMYGYVNGKQVGSVAFTNSVTNTDAELVIGTRNTNANATQSFDGSLALARVGPGSPSSEEIKEMYEDEKYLFQENAKCVLYGSSDTVTALAYDKVTEQLHVGTSSGRSDFQGLRRINNTTTAVTTAISAHDEFIIEQ